MKMKSAVGLRFWQKPKVLVFVCFSTSVVSFANAAFAFRRDAIWESFCWSAFGLLLVIWGWGLYYFNLGNGARKAQEEWEKRNAELDDFYRRLKEKK